MNLDDRDFLVRAVVLYVLVLCAIVGAGVALGLFWRVLRLAAGG